MDWVSLIGGVATSAASGGILGLAGSLFGGIFKYIQTGQQYKFEQKKWAHELELQKLELQRNREEDEHELQVISQQGAWQGLSQSIQADSSPVDTYKWSKTIKELYRPFFTTGIFVLVYLLFMDLMALFEGGEAALRRVFTPAEAKEILQYIVYSVVFTASTSGVWWFGDRAFAPPGMKNR